MHRARTSSRTAFSTALLLSGLATRPSRTRTIIWPICLNSAGPKPRDVPAGRYVVNFDPLDGSSNINAGVNIGTFHLGRRNAGGEAVLLLSVDEPVTPELIANVRALPGVKTAMALKF